MKPNKTKLLTVAIPNYNGESYIEETITSCSRLNLSSNDYEILIIDNLSSDNSLVLIRQLQKHIRNIRLVINDTNIGRLANWKKCIDLAKGKYINFLFVTNEFHTHYDIKSAIKKLEQDSTISMHISSMVAEKEPGKYSSANMFFQENRKLPSAEFIHFALASGREVPGYLQANVMRIEDIASLEFNEDHPFTADQLFASTAMLKRKYTYLSINPAVIWRICLNPNRFTANTPSEFISREILFAAHFQANMIGENQNTFLSRYYACELWRIIDRSLHKRIVITKQSNVRAAFATVFRQAKEKRINRIKIMIFFSIQMLKSTFSFLKKQLKAFTH